MRRSYIRPTRLSILIVSCVIGANLFSYIPAAAASLPNTVVTASALTLTPSTDALANQCLARYGLGASSDNNEEVTATFSNYSPGTEVRFRIYGQSGQVTHVIDYVTGTSPSQCNNLVANPGNYFPVTLASGITSLRILGIPNSVRSGYFQSVYVSGTSTSANVTVTAITFESTPSTTIAPPTTIVKSHPSLLEPIVTATSLTLTTSTDTNANTCLARYGLGSSFGANEEFTATFANYQPGTIIKFRIYGPSGQDTHVIDYVNTTTPNQCNNLVNRSSNDFYFSVRLSKTTNQLRLLGILNSFTVAYFQSIYADNSATSKHFSVTRLVLHSNSTPTIPPVTLLGSGTDLPGLRCAKYIFLGAPGSGQTLKYLNKQAKHGHSTLQLGDELYSIYLGLQRISPFSNNISSYSLLRYRGELYDASSVPSATSPATGPNSWSSYLTGMEFTAGLSPLTQVENECPGSYLILAGYSQGAAVMHEYLANVVHDGSAMSHYVRSHIIATLLVANPYAMPNDQHIVGEGPSSLWNQQGTQALGIVPFLASNVNYSTLIAGSPPGNIIDTTLWPNRGIGSILSAAEKVTHFSCDVKLLCSLNTTLKHVQIVYDSNVVSQGLVMYSAEMGYLIPDESISKELGSPIYSVTHEGDIVAEPFGDINFAQCGSISFRNLFNNWNLFNDWNPVNYLNPFDYMACFPNPSYVFSASVHTNAYVNDGLLTENEVAAVLSAAIKK